jgi:nucleotide-binding universal stress UspA family protein
MMTKAISNILVPTDFSDPSHAALHYARELARAFGASLHVLPVLDEAEMRGVVGSRVHWTVAHPARTGTLR